MSPPTNPDFRIDLHWAGDEFRPDEESESAPAGRSDIRPSSDNLYASLEEIALEQTVDSHSSSDDARVDVIAIPDLRRSFATILGWIKALESSSLQWLQGLEGEVSVLQRHLKSLSDEVELLRQQNPDGSRDLGGRISNVERHAESLQLLLDQIIGRTSVNGNGIAPDIRHHQSEGQADHDSHG